MDLIEFSISKFGDFTRGEIIRVLVKTTSPPEKGKKTTWSLSVGDLKGTAEIVHVEMLPNRYWCLVHIKKSML